MAEKEYYSFEEVLKDLKLEENELKRLVSAGEIRAFRDKNTMRFKAEDVARLRGTGGVEGDAQLDDLELDLDDAAPAAEAPAAEAEELVLEDTEAPAAAEVEELDLEVEAAAAAAPARGRGRERAAPRRTQAAEAAPMTMGEPEGKDSPLLVGALIVGVVVLIIANFVVLDSVTGTATGLSGAIAGMFG